MDTDESSMLAEAASCEDCLCWLHHCDAECCRGFRIHVEGGLPRVGDEIRIRLTMTPDVERYLELHGARIEGDVLVLPAGACELSDSELHVAMRCEALLDDLTCRLHPDGKPEGCKDLDWETAQQGLYGLTPRCLYAYKLRAGAASGAKR